jgi:hypothetical protein
MTAKPTTFGENRRTSANKISEFELETNSASPITLSFSRDGWSPILHTCLYSYYKLQVVLISIKKFTGNKGQRALLYPEVGIWQLWSIAHLEIDDSLAAWKFYNLHTPSLLLMWKGRVRNTKRNEIKCGKKMPSFME